MSSQYVIKSQLSPHLPTPLNMIKSESLPVAGLLFNISLNSVPLPGSPLEGVSLRLKDQIFPLS